MVYNITMHPDRPRIPLFTILEGVGAVAPVPIPIRARKYAPVETKLSHGTAGLAGLCALYRDTIVPYETTHGRTDRPSDSWYR